MQNEFGIAPDKIVEAFTKMDQKTLLGRPEESTVSFMNQLQAAVPPNVLASPKDQARIEALYQNMVETTSHAATSEKLLALQAGDVQQLPGSPDEALEKLAEAMDEIDAAFGQLTRQNPLDGKLKSQLAAESMNARLTQLAQQNKTGNAKQGDETILPAAALATAFAIDATIDTAAATSTAPAEVVAVPASTPAPLVGSSTLGGLANGSMGGGGSSSGSGSGGGSGSQGAKVALTSAAAGAAAVKAEGGSKKTEDKVAPSAKDSVAPIGHTQVADENALQPTKKAAVGAVAAGLERPQASSQDEQDNVRELIHQAQVVLKKGGGEIKMDLKPEGAGQVHLKVSVIDGQVNVQMLTENEATKHMLEKSLHELKTGLASHDLKLENLKVDVSQGANKNMDMDKQGDDQARQQARQFANDVMGQFRDERQAFQQGFMENPGWRQYGRPQNRANMSPESVAGTVGAAEAAKRMRSGGSSRLNLVA
jgi:flagellar hook-length control protein FliK